MLAAEGDQARQGAHLRRADPAAVVNGLTGPRGHANPRSLQTRSDDSGAANHAIPRAGHSPGSRARVALRRRSVPAGDWAAASTLEPGRSRLGIPVDSGVGGETCRSQTLADPHPNPLLLNDGSLQRPQSPAAFHPKDCRNQPQPDPARRATQRAEHKYRITHIVETQIEAYS